MKKEEIQALFKSCEDAACMIEQTECLSDRKANHGVQIASAKMLFWPVKE